ncbi:DUF2835 domain-containing protein [Shewanella sp. YIC-542]|uniref:DUF2835 domain-containing protein n=1 Tax=Shewanella mytili TaxID=3377111 RepID=UPI00398EC859
MTDTFMAFYFRLNLSFEEFKPYYQGIAETVQVRERGGKRLQINARHFRQFLAPDGIHGEFKLVVDRKGHFQSITRMD